MHLIAPYGVGHGKQQVSLYERSCVQITLKSLNMTNVGLYSHILLFYHAYTQLKNKTKKQKQKQMNT